MKCAHVYISSFFLVLIASCNPNNESGTTKEVTQQKENIYAMPTSLLKENVMETDYTAIVSLKSAEIIGDNEKIPGYVRHVYNAEVVETIKGPAYKNIKFSVWAEAGLSPNLSKHPVVVSLCEGEKKSLYVPDNGYVSDVTEELAEFARSLKGMGVAKDGKHNNVCSR